MSGFFRTASAQARHRPRHTLGQAYAGVVANDRNHVGTMRQDGAREGGRAVDAGQGPDAVLAALDPEQQEVALATRVPVCGLAGAGTGKTRAVAHPIGYADAAERAAPMGRRPGASRARPYAG